MSLIPKNNSTVVHDDIDTSVLEGVINSKGDIGIDIQFLISDNRFWL